MSFWFIVKRDVGSQWRWSKNLEEGVKLKSMRLFWVCIYFCKALILGFKAMRREQLGSEVVYQGRRLQISNWAGSDSPTLAGEDFYQQNVPRSEIKNIRSLREFRHRFKFGFSFYTSNWYSIDVNNRLYGK